MIATYVPGSELLTATELQIASASVSAAMSPAMPTEYGRFETKMYGGPVALVMVTVGVSVTVDVTVAVTVTVRVSVAVAVAVAVTVKVRVGVCVAVDVCEGVFVTVAVFVGVRVAVAVRVAVGVRVSVGVLEIVGVLVIVGVDVGSPTKGAENEMGSPTTKNFAPGALVLVPSMRNLWPSIRLAFVST